MPGAAPEGTRWWPLPWAAGSPVSPSPATPCAPPNKRARDRGLTARFFRHGARHLAELGETFDTVLDCGLFHLFTGADWAAYVASLRSALCPGGRCFMLGFSDAEPAGTWRHKLSRHDIIAAFTDGWRIDVIEPVTIDSRIQPAYVRAWRVALTRL